MAADLLSSLPALFWCAHVKAGRIYCCDEDNDVYETIGDINLGRFVLGLISGDVPLSASRQGRLWPGTAWDETSVKGWVWVFFGEGGALCGSVPIR